MESAKTTFEIWLAVNDDGDCATSVEGPSEAREAFVEDYGGACIRVVKLSARMTLPQVIEAEVAVADEVGMTEQVEAQAA